MQTHNKKQTIKRNVDPVETLRHAPSEVANDVTSELQSLGKQTVSELWETLLLKKKKLEGDLAPGEELSLADVKDKHEQKKPHAEAPIDYFREMAKGEKRAPQENEQVLRAQISEIQIQIKELIASTQELRVKVKEVVVEQAVEKPGKYHQAFYEWFLSMLKNWKQEVEDASSWLSALQSKKKSKGYWQLFKKHGTSFGLSSERYMVQQTG